MLPISPSVAKIPVSGIITLHPHPASTTSLAALIAGNDDEGLEQAARLFPLRTGVPVSPLGPFSRDR